MKLRLFIISILFTLCTTFSQTNHIGEWKGKDGEGKEASLTFKEDGYFKFCMGDMIFESNDTTFSKSKYVAKYVFNYSKTPIWLDINLYDSSKRLVNTLKSIVRFIKDDKMIWAISRDQTRPDTIDVNNKKNTIVLFNVK